MEEPESMKRLPAEECGQAAGAAASGSPPQVEARPTALTGAEITMSRPL